MENNYRSGPYHCMYSCTMPVPDSDGRGGGRRGRECPFFSCIIYTVMFLGSIVEVWGVSMDRTRVMLTVK